MTPFTAPFGDHSEVNMTFGKRLEKSNNDNASSAFCFFTSSALYKKLDKDNDVSAFPPNPIKDNLAEPILEEF
jgi:hypothetical protein